MAQKPEDARSRFVANVERLRGRRGYSVELLAERSGIGSGELEAILDGEAEASAESILRLAGALDVAPGELHAGVTWVPDGEGAGEYRVEDPGGGSSAKG
jgi:transcriptional regulator with XRE-family HTH domain